MITIRKYSASDKQTWNDFNKTSKNSIFMFDRDYMDYHSDRFKDHSLLFFYDDELISILPLSEKDAILYSHGGLTYGGFITNEHMKQHIMNECFSCFVEYAKNNGFNKVIYKCIPHIYHLQPSEEDRFSLYANNAKLANIDASTYLNLKNPLKMAKGRKAQISRAKREGVQIKELDDLESFNAFIDVENEVLSSRHNTKAVHNGKELKMLHDKFPDNIKLFAAVKDNTIIGGSVAFVYRNAVHIQYMAANEEARVIGALDLSVHEIIEKYKNDKEYIDFGISTEHNSYLNEGLCSQKESFGGRTGVYEIWELDF